MEREINAMWKSSIFDKRDDVESSRKHAKKKTKTTNNIRGDDKYRIELLERSIPINMSNWAPYKQIHLHNYHCMRLLAFSSIYGFYIDHFFFLQPFLIFLFSLHFRLNILVSLIVFQFHVFYIASSFLFRRCPIASKMLFVLLSILYCSFGSSVTLNCFNWPMQ